ncbi:PPM-type phosphatase-like domain containing protein [Babesia gibsoni]|uniref:protein-serine/threonine phosphatase n=1 Tax=Babesia gibsoni TaxID=33632 RepID=A0AAD8PF31_BABGI|nr:PPM-type phosphatase-like domain containing protein [Babesia gibsoni]
MLRRSYRPVISFLNLYSHFLSMGAHLSSPKTDKFSFYGGDLKVNTTRYGASSMQGWRVSMEDAHLALVDLYNPIVEEGGSARGDPRKVGQRSNAKPNKGDDGATGCKLVGIYGVFDGHGGSCVSQWVSENFADLLKEEITKYNDLRAAKQIELKSLDAISETQAVLAESLQSAFMKVDEELKKPETEHALRKINEKTRSENQSDSFVDGSSLFKVLLPDRVPNRQQTIRLIEQHTERLLRESFNFNNNQHDIHVSDDPTRYGEDDGDYQAKCNDDTEDNLDDDDEYNDEDMAAGDKGMCNDSETFGVDEGDEDDDDDDENDVNRKPDGLVTRVVNEDDSIKSGDCVPDDEYDMDGDITGDSPNLAFGCGSTSVVVMVLDGEAPSLLVANAGDSRAVLCRGGQAVALSHDHKPQLREEGERIRRAGGSVTNGRVDGNLNLSRSLGDLAFKRDTSLPPAEQRISAMPDVRICPLAPEDEFVVLACDGIWDCKNNQQVVDFVRKRLFDDSTDGAESVESGAETNRLAKICEELCDECLSGNPSESEGVGCDNMTVIIVQLSKNLVDKCSTTAKPIALYGKQVDLYL